MFKKKIEKFEFKTSTREKCRMQILAVLDYQKSLEANSGNIIEQYMIGFKNKGVSIKAFQSAQEKIKNDELELVTKDEYGSLTIFFALILYKARVDSMVIPEAKRVFFSFFEFFTMNELIRIYNDKFCEWPTRQMDGYTEYLDDSIGIYLTSFEPLAMQGVLPEFYFAKLNELMDF